MGALRMLWIHCGCYGHSVNAVVVFGMSWAQHGPYGLTQGCYGHTCRSRRAFWRSLSSLCPPASCTMSHAAFAPAGGALYMGILLLSTRDKLWGD
eukprot:7285863-Pyramimonas_sp.AAC.2